MRTPLISCSRGHRYPKDKRWCICGELNPHLVPDALPKPLCSFMLHKVPRTLRIRFREACHQEGTIMRAEILGFMERYATGNGWPPRREIDDALRAPKILPQSFAQRKKRRVDPGPLFGPSAPERRYPQ